MESSIYQQQPQQQQQLQQRAQASDGDGGILKLSLLFFATLYSTAFLFIFRRWRPAKRSRASSSCISFAHSLFGSALAIRELSSSPWSLDSLNTPAQNRIMEWSMAYFLIDLLHYFISVPDDHLFIAHHLATFTFMFTCRYHTFHGAKSVMSLIAAGEVTTPLQSIWTLARLARDESPTAGKVFARLSPYFTVLFTITRGVFGPYLLVKQSSFYLSGGADHVVPRWLAYTWMFKLTFGVVGSLIWAIKLWKGLFKFYSRNDESGRRARAT